MEIIIAKDLIVFTGLFSSITSGRVIYSKYFGDSPTSTAKSYSDNSFTVAS